MKPVFKIILNHGKYVIVREESGGTYFPVYQNGKLLQFNEERLAMFAKKDLEKLYENVIEIRSRRSAPSNRIS